MTLRFKGKLKCQTLFMTYQTLATQNQPRVTPEGGGDTFHPGYNVTSPLNNGEHKN